MGAAWGEAHRLDSPEREFPSKVRSFFKKVGYGLGVAGAFVVVAPSNGVAVLLGGGSIPGCP